MAIAIDTSTSPSAGVGISGTYTWSHTCTGSDLVLVVGIWMDSTGSDVVTGVTYNGVALTRINTASAGGFRTYLYAMVGPATGSHSVVVSFTGTQTIVAGSASYSGVSQSGLPDAQNTNSGSGSTLSCSVTTIADNCWLVAQYGNNASASSAGSGSFLRLQENGTAHRAIYDSNGAKTPAGSYSIDVNNGSSGLTYILNVMSIAPVAAVAPTKQLAALGVG